LGRESERSTPSSVEDKNIWSYISSSPYVFKARCIIKHMESIIFYSSRVCYFYLAIIRLPWRHLAQLCHFLILFSCTDCKIDRIRNVTSDMIISKKRLMTFNVVSFIMGLQNGSTFRKHNTVLFSRQHYVIAQRFNENSAPATSHS
jgi:hypothetical protein